MVKYIDNKLVKKLLPLRKDDCNKGSFLKVLNVSGSNCYSGAAFLSSLSSYRVGAGLVCLACPQSIINRFSANIPELVYLPLKDSDLLSISADNDISFLYDYPIVSIGCGISIDSDTKQFVEKIVKNLKNQKIVIDADAINIMAELNYNKTVPNSIFTPHPKELSRLLNVSLDEILQNREKYARITSQKYDCITVLKGKDTIVTDGDNIYINTTGSSALSKAGTGDVLTGIISGLLSQHLSCLDAAILGVYLHGRAGDLAESDLSKYSVLASDVIDYLPFVINELLLNEWYYGWYKRITKKNQRKSKWL